MVKKVIKKGEVSKKTIPKSPEKLAHGGSLEIKLIENFVSLQKVMVNLSVKFDELSNNISKLLELFELSATALAKKDINFTKPMDEEKIVGKLNAILDQNKIIARGMALLGEGREPEKTIQAESQFQKPQAPSHIIKGEYQKSPFQGF